MHGRRIRISLRGTLAAEYLISCNQEQDEDDAATFLSTAFNDDRNLKIVDPGGMVIIGKKSEAGQFPPDW